MPFDGLGPSGDPTTLFRERREAAAALWRAVRTPFFMAFWSTCAVGWLAGQRHDGWHMDGDGVPCSADGQFGHCAAAAYFGLSRDDTLACFGGMQGFVTPALVAARLLAAPYDLTVNVSGHRLRG